MLFAFMLGIGHGMGRGIGTHMDMLHTATRGGGGAKGTQDAKSTA